MYVLLYIGLAPMAFMGTFADLPSCQHAIREIHSVQMNPAGQRLPELNESISIRTAMQKTFVCVPQKKS